MVQTKNILFILSSFILLIKLQCQNTYQEIFNNGPACKNGRIQTPLILSDKGSKYNPEFLLTDISYNSLNNIYVNFDYRILKVFQSNVNYPNFGKINYKKQGSLNEYELIDIEFYYPAEHRINVGGSLIVPDVEVKLIHKKNKMYSATANELKNFTESNSFLIVSLLYSQNGTNSDNNFLADLSLVYNPSISPMMMKNIDFDTYGLIKNNRYFMYDGSFSYFPCDENVSYIVVRDLFQISPSDIQNFISRYNLKYSNPQVNKAIAQPFGRPIYRNYVTLGSSYIKKNLLFAFIILFFI